MKTLFAALMLTFMACGTAGESTAEGLDSNTSAPAPAQDLMKDVKVEDLKSAITTNANIQVLDVRTPGEIAEGYIEGATRININDADFKARVEAEVDKTKPVYVYCKMGGRSAKAAKMMQDMGFTEVHNVKGGITAWNKAGYPTVK